MKIRNRHQVIIVAQERSDEGIRNGKKGTTRAPVVIKYRVFQCVGCLEVVEVDGEMKGMKKSETTPRFYEGDWENNSTVNRNKDIRKS